MRRLVELRARHPRDCGAPTKRTIAAALVLAGTLAALSTAARPARAQGLHGLSVRVGGYFPTSGARTITDFVAWGGGLQYEVPWRVPALFSGEHWTTSISADFHYSERKAGILRYVPVTLNQVYTFEPQGGHTPYAGFGLGAATFGTTGAAERVSTTTRFMGSLILGLNIDPHFYVEGRYDWVNPCMIDPSGFRAYVGFRF